MKKIKTKYEKELSKRVRFLEQQVLGALLKNTDDYKQKEEKKKLRTMQDLETEEADKLRALNHKEIYDYLKCFEEANPSRADSYLLSLDENSKKSVIINREYIKYPIQTKHPLGFGLVDGSSERQICVAYLIDWSHAGCDILSDFEYFLNMTIDCVIRVRTLGELKMQLSALEEKQKWFIDRMEGK